MSNDTDARGTDEPPEVTFRHRLNEQFPTPSVAFSADGRLVQVAGPVTLGVTVGGFAVVERRSDPARLVVIQVRDLHTVERDGPMIRFDEREDYGGLGAPGSILTTRLRVQLGEGTVLGTLGADGFAATDQVEPFGEEFVRAASAAEVATVREAADAEAATIEIGVLRDAPDVPARLQSKGFSRHTFMCGQSGSGKTYTTGVLFERLLHSTNLPLLILDPNSDHVHLGRLADPDDRSPEADRYRRVADSVTTVRARGLDGTYTLCIDFSDLDPEIRARLLHLDPIADLDEFHALMQITESLRAPFSVDDVAHAAAQADGTASIARRIENLRLADWGLWRRDGEESAAAEGLGDDRCLVVDTGSLATRDERSAVALAILGSRWQARRDRRPMLLAIDEAHNVLPAATTDPLLQATTEIGVLIAGEGRKFGLHLFVASQRPGKVHPNVLSQCDNLILMRMNGVGDVAELEALFSHVRPMLLRESLTFGLGQALFAGRIAPVPLLTKVGTRLTPEGGGDVPTTWAAPAT